MNEDKLKQAGEIIRVLLEIVAQGKFEVNLEGATKLANIRAGAARFVEEIKNPPAEPTED